jgi:hypothetical protein
VRRAHPLRRINEVLDLSFVREQVAHTYGRRGNKSVILSVWNRKAWALFRSMKQRLDSTGPFRVVMVLMFATLAKQEAARISERTKPD